MKKFDKKIVDVIRYDIKRTHREVEKKHGITFSIGTITYTKKTFRCKLECAIPDIEGEPVMAQVFRTKCHKYGYTPEDLYKTFYSKGNLFKIVGLKPANRKYPILAEKIADGRLYKFSPHYVRGLLKYFKD